MGCTLCFGKRTVRLKNLGRFGDPHHTMSNNASSINDLGDVVGTSEANDGTVHAFLWTRAKGRQDLGTLTPSAFLTVAGCCRTVNNRDEVVGFSIDPNGMRAFLWKDGKMRDLDGYINYGPDGRMIVIIVGSDRKKPVGPVATPNEAEALIRSMLAYAGGYTVDSEAKTITHQIDVSWDQSALAKHTYENTTWMAIGLRLPLNPRTTRPRARRPSAH